MQKIKLNNDWGVYLKNEFKKLYFLKLKKFIDFEYKQYTCYPNKNNIFSCFNFCSFEQTKVIILGQDPYYKPNQANGLCFSVYKNTPLPSSLKNIFKEIKNDIGDSILLNGDLSSLAKQGVLLLNCILTVRSFQVKSHKNQGWEIFTDKVIQILSKVKKNLVFILWGEYAKKKYF